MDDRQFWIRLYGFEIFGTPCAEIVNDRDAMAKRSSSFTKWEPINQTRQSPEYAWVETFLLGIREGNPAD